MTVARPRTTLKLAVLLVLGAVGLSTYILFQNQTFRSAALDLRLTRGEAIQKARRFLENRGYNLEGSEKSASFFSNDEPILYLEKSVGTTQTNEWLRAGGFPVWGWEVRFFWPLKKEEYQVWWSPGGELLGFKHDILRETRKPSLSQEKALALAVTFARERPEFSLSNYDLVERSSEEKTRRTDHTFRWKARQNYLQSRLYFRATVSGDELSSFRNEIQIPQAFTRFEQEIGSRRDLLSLFTERIDWLLKLATFIFLIQAWRRGWIRWKAALLLAGAVTVVEFLNLFNSLPSIWHGYRTHESVSSFWINRIGLGSLVLLGAMGWGILPFCSSDAMGRSLPGSSYSLGEVTRGAFYRSKPFFLATIAGFGAAGIQLGFVVAFYLLGTRFFHFYAPLDIPYSDLLTSSIPWVQPLLVGLSAALQEESVYRLFAISLLLRWTRRKWIALLLPAALWGFLHTGYYVEPIYVRGLELTLVGLFFGIIFLKFGIWATIVCHYTYNATVTSSVFLGSENPYAAVSSALTIGILAVPFLWSSVRLFFAKRFRELPFHPLPWALSVQRPWSGIDRRRAPRRDPPLQAVPAVAAIAILLLVSALLPWGNPLPKMDLDRKQAIKAARINLEDLGYKLDRHVSSATLYHSSRGIASHYIREKLPPEEASKYLDRYEPRLPFWSVRFVATGHPEECSSEIEAHRKLSSFSCELDQEMPGASLAPGESRDLAERYLPSQGYRGQELRYVGIAEHDQPARKDSTHRWVDVAATIEELKRYVEIDVAGDRISSFDTFLQPPESYLRSKYQRTTWQAVRNVILMIAGLIAAGLVLRAVFDREVTKSLFAALPAQAALLGAGLCLLDWLNELPRFWWEYESTSSMEVYISQKLLLLLGKILSNALVAYLAVLLYLRITPQVFPTAPTEEDLRIVTRRPPWSWRGSREAFLWALGLVMTQVFIRHLFDCLSGDPSADAIGTNFKAFWSALPILTGLNSIWTGLLFWIGFAAMVAVSRKYLNPTLGGTALVLLIGGATLFQARGSDEVALQLVNFLLVVFVLVRRVRFHLPFYLWYAFLSTAVPLLPWLFAGHRFFQLHAFLMAVSILLVVLTLFRPTPRPISGTSDA